MSEESLNEKRTAFLAEYKALCLKHGLMLDYGHCGSHMAYVTTIPPAGEWHSDPLEWIDLDLY